MKETYITPSGLKVVRTPKVYLIGNDQDRYDRTSAVLGVINKPNLIDWYKKVGFEKAETTLKEAGELGTRVHAMVEEICWGRDPWQQIKDTDIAVYYAPYVRWHEAHVRQILLIEQLLWSDAYGYAGSLDSFAEMKACSDTECPTVGCKTYAQDGLLALLDVKTSRWLSWTYRLQTAAYQLAALERNLIPDVDLRAIVHLSSRKPGTLTVKPYWEHELEQQRWLSALDLYRGQQEHEDDWKD